MTDNILQDITYNKLQWIEKHKKKIPLDSIKENIKNSNRDFYKILKINKPSFILEIKQSSPSGMINNQFNIIKIAKCYKKYATAISVLTDEKYFNGRFEFLPIVKKITHQPILCKDFFIDPYQIYLARLYKADAILLMLSILNDNQYTILSNLAISMNMNVLTEIHNISELNRAIKLKSKIIGINNRNLNDLSININKTHQIAPLIPKDKIIISESGISNNIEIKKLKKIVHGFLIGTSIMQSKDINLKINNIIFGNNKICGLTRTRDSKRAKRLGATYGGLIFVKKSIRNINLKKAQEISNSCKLKYIGVFQNETIENILLVLKKIHLYGLQLHGSEDQEYINNLKKKLPNKIKIIKALNPNDHIKKIHIKRVDYFLFDNYHGGSGLCFNWSKIQTLDLSNVFISGGLSNKNCYKISKLNCFGLDFNSKLEKAPGIKDYKKMKILFEKLKKL